MRLRYLLQVLDIVLIVTLMVFAIRAIFQG